MMKSERRKKRDLAVNNIIIININKKGERARIPNPFILYTKIIQEKKPLELYKKRDSSEEGGDERKRCLFVIRF